MSVVFDAHDEMVEVEVVLGIILLDDDIDLIDFLEVYEHAVEVEADDELEVADFRQLVFQNHLYDDNDTIVIFFAHLVYSELEETDMTTVIAQLHSLDDEAIMLLHLFIDEVEIEIVLEIADVMLIDTNEQ